MISHHAGCHASYPEKPAGEPARFLVFMNIGKDVLATCGDCGAWERYKRTTVADFHTPACESKPYTMTQVYSNVGRTRVDLDCPYCGRTVVAFLWSLSGGGKRCPCGAFFGSRGTAYKLKVSS